MHQSTISVWGCPCSLHVYYNGHGSFGKPKPKQSRAETHPLLSQVEVRDEARRGLSPSLLKQAEQRDREREAGQGKREGKEGKETKDESSLMDTSSDTQEILSPITTTALALALSPSFPSFGEFVQYAGVEFKKLETVFR